jgi:RecA/RadA recombinase
VGIFSDQRLVIFVGRFGSGKTEVAINYAVHLARQRPQVALVDLDLVTPYFRSRDMTEVMQAHGVEVIAPAAVARHIDLPAVTPQILSAILDLDRAVVLDVGGDEMGARAGLGQFSHHIAQRGYRMNLVVNPYRPETRAVAGVAQAVRDIEHGSRLQVHALVSNPNLMEETTWALVRAGHALVEEAGRELGLPVAFACLEERLAQEVSAGDLRQPLLTLSRYFLPPWQG